jgi:uncharacterized sulfatase
MKEQSAWTALLLAVLLPSCDAAPGAPDRERDRPPSVLLILVDDLTTDLGAYGNDQVETPHLDRLAGRGTRFAHAYAQFPLCHPSRISLLAGRYPEATGVFDNETDARIVLRDAAFLPEHFRRHGYRTARFGKIVHTEHKASIAWGEPLDLPATAGTEGAPALDLAAAMRERQMPSPPGVRRLTGDRRAVGWQAAEGEDAGQPDGRIARRAAAWLEAQHGEPFFLAVGFNKPHPPFVAPRRYFDRYDPSSLVLDDPSDPPPDIPAAALDFALVDSAMTEAQRRRATAAYYACISFVDTQVGLLLDALDRLALWEDTIVVLASDHGMHLGERGGLWRKLTLFEEALRVPLLVVVPGGTPGSVVVSPVELVDLYPTLSELAGLAPPPGLQGTSLAAQLLDPQAPGRAAAYSVLGLHPAALGRTVRTECYRYVAWPGDGQGELWDLVADPHSTRNLFSDPRHRPQVEELSQLLDARRRGASSMQAAQSSM